MYDQKVPDLTPLNQDWIGKKVQHNTSQKVYSTNGEQSGNSIIARAVENIASHKIWAPD